MNYFLEIYDKIGEFIVPGEKLKEYGVLNNICTSSKIKRLLDESNFIENEDYQVSNVGQQWKESRGIKKKTIYMLTPNTFRLALISWNWKMSYLIRIN